MVVVWARMAGALLAGLALAAAFPPYDLVWLAPLAVALLVVVTYRRRFRSGFGMGFLAGLTFFAVLVRWLAVVGDDAWILLVAYCALWLGLVGGVTGLVTRLRWWPLWVACGWVGQEALRGRVPLGGFPWGRLAFAQTDTTLTPYAAVAGAPAVTFATALAGAMVAAVVIAWRPGLVAADPGPEGADPGPEGAVRGRRRAVAAPAAGLLVVCLAGLLVPLPTGGQDDDGPAQTTAAVVQGNVPELGLGFNDQARAVLTNHVRATEELARRVDAGLVPAPDFVVWPENASDVDPYLDPLAAQEIQRAVDAVGVPTLVGAVVVNQDDPTTVLNVGVVWSPRTGPGDRYVKRHPVPFGEYIPFRSVLAPLIGRFDRIPRDFAAGDRIGVLQLGPARVGVVICFEIAYDTEVRDAVIGDTTTPGGRLLVVQTNNATYGRTGQPDQQLAMSRLRAVEHGRTVLIAATSGISAVIAPDGRLVSVGEEDTATTLVEQVAMRDTLTVADRLGAWPEWAAALAALAACVAATTRRRRGIGSSDPITTTEDPR